MFVSESVVKVIMVVLIAFVTIMLYSDPDVATMRNTKYFWHEHVLAVLTLSTIIYEYGKCLCAII